MATNPYNNKVELSDGTVLMDLTGDTVTPIDLALGVTAHDRSGASITGTQKGFIYYGTCSTAKATQKKTVSIDGITELYAGLCLRISFSNEQTYNGVPTLQVNSLTAANIRRVSGTNAARYEWNAGEVLDLVYDGTYFVIVDGAVADTTYYGITKLSESSTSTSAALSATPSAVNKVAQYIATGLPIYSSSATYAVGDRVRYGSYMYECNTAITTAEAWTVEHWTALDPLLTMVEARIKASEKGTANGIAELDSSAKVPTSRLPYWVGAFSNTTDIRTQVDGLAAPGVYYGTIASPSESYFPGSTSGFLYLYAYNANYKHLFYIPNGTSDIYVISKGSTWGTWEKIPSSSDINAITEHFKWVSFVNTSAVTTQIDTLNGTGAYFGRVEYAAAAGLPSSTSGIIYAYCYGENYKHVYYLPNASADEQYYIEKKNGTWQSWVLLPTKSDIDTIQSNITSLTTATTPEAATLTPGTNVTLANVKTYQVGKLGVLSFSMTTSASIASGTNLVTGLPRPTSLTWIVAYSSTPAIHPLYINSAGQLKPSGAISAGEWIVSATYVADYVSS